MQMIQKMSSLMLIVGASLVFMTSGSALANEVEFVEPGELIGFAGDSSSIPGAKHFRIYNDEDTGVVAVKIWLPANSDIPAHGRVKEGKAAAVMVLSGDLELGMGDQFDANKLVHTPVGSVVILTPGNDTHYGRTGHTPVELLQILGDADQFAVPLKND